MFIPNQTEPARLKRPVADRGSILLGELVAILIALELVSKGAKIRNRYNQVPHLTQDKLATEKIITWYSHFF